MNFRKILWTHYVRKNGSCSVKIYAYDDDSTKDYRYFGTKICVKPEEWDEVNEIVTANNKQAKILNAKIQETYNVIKAHFEEGGTLANYGIRNNNASLIELGERVIKQQYIEREDQGVVELKTATLKKYQASLNIIRGYCDFNKIKDLTFNNVTVEFYRHFKDYIFEHTACKELVSFGNHVKIIKSLMNYGLFLGIHNSKAHQDPKFKLYKNSSSKKIYLTEDEMNRIEALDLSFDPYLEQERDRFLVQYAFIFRFSDVMKLRKENVFELSGQRYLRVFHQKTDKQVILPVKDRTWQLMEKYNFRFDFTSNQDANKALKLIGSMAAISDPTTQGKKTAPKFFFIGTHTARRSAATLMYLANVSLKMIADLGGWESEKTLSIYLRASGLDVAIAAKDLKHFQ